ncbi:MAG TPA: hypothetical protein VF172_05210 [Nitrososphaera sp.]|jgi:hypothetical protein
MESATLATTRLIEYPSDLSGCSSIDIEGRQLLYLCCQGSNKYDKSFVVILGFFSGQKEDIVTKDLIESIPEEIRRSLSETVVNTLSGEHKNARIFFL